MMTILQFIENRPTTTYNKHIRVMDFTTRKNLGKWYDGDNPYKKIKDVKITQRYIFLLV